MFLEALVKGFNYCPISAVSLVEHNVHKLAPKSPKNVSLQGLFVICFSPIFIFIA